MRTMLLTIGADLTLTGALPSTPVGFAGSYTLTARGGTEPYTITVQTEDFPAEWTITPNGDGTVDIDTPEAELAGEYSVTFLVEDAERREALITRSLRVVALPLEISGSLANMTVGSAYSDTLDIVGGIPPYELVLAYTVPDGVVPTLAGGIASPLTFAGTPTGAGLGPGTSIPFDVNVSIRDSSSPTPQQVSFDQTITITVAPVVTVFASLPDGEKDEAYSGDVNATGGTGNYVFSLDTAPGWMSINSSTGALSGTPVLADVGTGITVTARATDSEGNTDTVSDTMDVTNGPSDPGFAFVTGLMHFDAANGTTTIAEVTGNSAWARDNVGAAVSNAHPKWGAGFWDTSNTFFQNTTLNSALNFGTNDWAVEFWLWIDAFTDQTVFDNRRGGGYSTEIVLYVPTPGATNFALYVDGANRATTSSLAINTWHHIRIGRTSGNVYIKLNGVQQGSNYAFAGNMNNTRFTFGANLAGLGNLNGGFDDVRISNGYDRFAEAVPTAAYPDQ